MKHIIKIVSVFLLLSLAFALTSCSSFGTVKKNFTSAGYTYVKNAEGNEAATAKTIVADLDKGQLSCTIHTFQKETAEVFGQKVYTYAIVLEFNSSEELLKAFEEDGSATLKGLIQDAQNSKYVRDNCILIPSVLNNNEKVEIFNK